VINLATASSISVAKVASFAAFKLALIPAYTLAAVADSRVALAVFKVVTLESTSVVVQVTAVSTAYASGAVVVARLSAIDFRLF